MTILVAILETFIRYYGEKNENLFLKNINIKKERKKEKKIVSTRQRLQQLIGLKKKKRRRTKQIIYASSGTFFSTKRHYLSKLRFEPRKLCFVFCLTTSKTFPKKVRYAVFSFCLYVLIFQQIFERRWL